MYTRNGVITGAARVETTFAVWIQTGFLQKIRQDKFISVPF